MRETSMNDEADAGFTFNESIVIRLQKIDIISSIAI